MPIGIKLTENEEETRLERNKRIQIAENARLILIASAGRPEGTHTFEDCLFEAEAMYTKIIDYIGE